MSHDLFTQQILNIPKAIARKYSSDPQIIEEIESAGNLALAQAARDFDPSKGCMFSTLAYSRVNWAAMEVMGRNKPYSHAYRWSKVASLGDEDAWKIPDRNQSPQQVVEDQDLINRLLSGIKPLHRAAYLLVERDGYNYKEVAQKIGVSGSCVGYWVDQVRGKVKSRARYIGRKKVAGVPGNPPHTEKQIEATKKRNRERAIERRLLGFIPTRLPVGGVVWYLADDENKKLYGPYDGLWKIMGLDKPLKGVRRPKEIDGKRPVRGPEGRKLVLEEDYVLSS